MKPKGYRLADVFGRSKFYELANRFYYTTQFDEGQIAAISALSDIDDLPYYDKHWDLAGTGGTVSQTEDGQCLTSGATDNNTAQLFPNVVAGTAAWNDSTNFFDISAAHTYSRRHHCRWAFSVDNIATVAIKLGLAEGTNGAMGATTGACDEQCAIVFDTDAATTFKVVTSVAGTDTLIETGITPEADCTYIFEVEIDSAFYPHYWFDGTYVGKGPVLDSTTYYMPCASVQSLAGSAGRNLALKALEFSKLWDSTLNQEKKGSSEKAEGPRY